MFLEKLEIKGFKSFAERTALSFRPGLTSVVGPNGSGKSNLVDAIRWVMGEQSAKNLRSKRGGEVIFAGGKSRAGMGLAEVSMYLNNEDGQMPVDYSRVVLTRRLYKTGESEYLLNQGKVRLHEIQTLLARSGFGQRTYGIVGQGMIGSLIEATAKERLAMFEDAAGVRGFRLKREQAIKKLQSARLNLDRVEEILAEVEPRYRYLERLVKKEEKRKKVKEELSEIEAELFATLWVILRSRQEETLEKQEKLTLRKDEVVNRINEWRKLASASQVGERLAEMEKVRDRLSYFEKEKAALAERILLIKHRLANETEVGKIEEWKDKIGRGEEELNAAWKTTKTKENDLSEKRAILADLEEKEAKVQKEIEMVKNKINEVNGVDLRELVIKVVEDLEQVEGEDEKIVNELKNCSDISKLKQICDRLVRNHQISKRRLFGLREKIRMGNNLEDIETELIGLKEQRKKLTKAVSEHRILVAVVETEIKSFRQKIADKEIEIRHYQKMFEELKMAGEGEDYKEEMGEIDELMTRFSQRIDHLGEGLKEDLGQVRKREEWRVKIEENLRLEDERLFLIRGKIDGLKSGQDQLQVSLNNLDQEIRQKYGPRAKFQKDVWDKKQGSYRAENIKKLEEKRENLKQTIAGCGVLEAEVKKEYRECRERIEFLKKQRADVIDAVTHLEDLIKELGGKIKNNFEGSFELIANKFQKYFEILFGGGRVDLRRQVVKDGEDEGVGIEIRVVPPGRRVSSIESLSGGEKALSSVALLMAFIENNPSPFIVLDEVDAALDEANSGRLADIVQEMSQKVQFVSVTHNRETMKRAAVLYGVTRAGDGVSKVLSLDFEKISRGEFVYETKKEVRQTIVA